MQPNLTPSKRYRNFYDLLRLSTKEYDGQTLHKLFPELQTVHGLAQLTLFLVRYHWQRVFSDSERQLALYLYQSAIDESGITLDTPPSTSIEKEMISAWTSLGKTKPNIFLTIEDKVINNLIKSLKDD